MIIIKTNLKGFGILPYLGTKSEETWEETGFFLDSSNLGFNRSLKHKGKKYANHGRLHNCGLFAPLLQ